MKFDRPTTEPTTERQPEYRRGDEIMAMEFTEPDAVIENRLYKGLNVVAARPKKKKSFHCLQMAKHVISGAPYNGHKVNRTGSVVYFALEDNDRRLKKRMRKQGWTVEEAKQLHVYYSASNLQDIKTAIKKHKPAAVVIDTLGAFFRGKSFNSFEKMSKAMYDLEDLSRDHDLAFLLSAHTRKPFDAMNPGTGLDELLGSTAIAAALVLNTHIYQKGKDYRFHIEGRDIEEDIPVLFDGSTCTWREIAEPEQTPTKRDRVLQSLLEEGEADAEEICERLGLDPEKERANISGLCAGLRDEGMAVSRKEGKRVIYSALQTINTHTQLHT